MQVAGRKKSFAGLKKLFLRRAKFILGLKIIICNPKIIIRRLKIIIFRLKINFCSCLWHFSLPAFVVFPACPRPFPAGQGRRCGLFIYGVIPARRGSVKKIEENVIFFLKSMPTFKITRYICSTKARCLP